MSMLTCGCIEENQLAQKQRQAINEGGLILTFSEEDAAGNTIDSLSSVDKDKTSSANKQENEEKLSDYDFTNETEEEWKEFECGV